MCLSNISSFSILYPTGVIFKTATFSRTGALTLIKTVKGKVRNKRAREKGSEKKTEEYIRHTLSTSSYGDLIGGSSPLPHLARKLLLLVLDSRVSREITSHSPRFLTQLPSIFSKSQKTQLRRFI
jgi:hypothetical protein